MVETDFLFHSFFHVLLITMFQICFKKLSVKIPKNFVAEGESPSKTFDIGELNLAGAFSGQDTDCLN